MVEQAINQLVQLTPLEQELTVVANSASARLRAFLATDACTEKGRLRSDDLLGRERVGRDSGRPRRLSGT